jgi:hypothetical protein
LRKGPSGKAGFCISIVLSSGFSPALDQLQQRLIAASQSLACLYLIQIRDSLLRQCNDKLMLAFGDQPFAVAPHRLSFHRGCVLHKRDRTPNGQLENLIGQIALCPEIRANNPRLWTEMAYFPESVREAAELHCGIKHEIEGRIGSPPQISNRIA